MKKYKICVRLPETRPLTYITSTCEIKDGTVRFQNERDGTIKILDLRLCEIEEVAEDFTYGNS
jgi:hypothetical protein